MSLNIPTTQELADRNINEVETKLNRSAPSNPVSLIRVISIMLAMGYTLNTITLFIVDKITIRRREVPQEPSLHQSPL